MSGDDHGTTGERCQGCGHDHQRERWPHCPCCNGTVRWPVSGDDHGDATEVLARHLADSAPNALCWHDLGPIGQSAWLDVARGMLAESAHAAASDAP